MLTHGEQHAMVIEPRFDGFPNVAHGGYVAGVLAATLGASAAEIRLRRPVETGRRLTLERSDDTVVELREGDTLLAVARAGDLSLDVPLPVTLVEAEEAAKRHPGLRGHLFPRCFGCGPQRTEGDGLRIFPGPVAGRRLVAAPWIPPAAVADASGRVPAELVWAALDCPQLWSLIVHAPADSPARVVTEALAVRVEHPVWAEEPHVVMAWPLGCEGRRWFAAAAVVGPGGELCALGRQTATTVSWGVPLGGSHWCNGKDEITHRHKEE